MRDGAVWKRRRIARIKQPRHIKGDNSGTSSGRVRIVALVAQVNGQVAAATATAAKTEAGGGEYQRISTIINEKWRKMTEKWRNMTKNEPIIDEKWRKMTENMLKTSGITKN